MSISKRNKLIVVLVALLSLSVLFGSVNLFKGNADQTSYSVEQVTDAESGTFKMASGAYIRNNDQDAVTSGLKYALTLSEEHYNGLKQSVANGDYDAIEFGVFILPKAYNDVYAVRDYAFASDANENTPKYNWAIKNAEGVWEYTAENGKARIFNLTGDAMVYDEKLGLMAFYGVITNVLPENMGKEMLAVGYLACTVGEETKYVFTSQADEVNNVRTMAYVAQKAIDAGATNATWLTSTYIKPVVDAGVNYSYSVEYYFGNQNGEYVLNESKTLNSSAVLGTTITANTDEIAGYTLNAEKSIVSGEVIALNGALTLKCYYDQKPLTIVNNEELALIEVNEIPTLDIVSDYGYDISDYTLTAVLTAPNGRVITSTTPNEILTAEIPQGVYTVELLADNSVVYTATVDIYNSNDGMVWQEISEYTVNDVRLWKYYYTDLGQVTINNGAIEFANRLGDDGNDKGIAIRVRALHSKAYYELMSTTYSDITFDLYIVASDGVDTYVMGNKVWKKAKATHTFSISSEYLLENWDVLNNITKKYSESVGQKLTNYGTFIWFNPFQQTEYTHTFRVSNFGSKARDIEAINVEGIQLIETEITPTYNLLDLDAESVLSKDLNYKATLTAKNGTVVEVNDVTNVITANIPQGVYAVDLTLNGVTVLTATIDIYTATDGLVWQEITENTVKDSRVWQYGFNNLGATTYSTISNVPVLQFTTVAGDSGKTNNEGIRLRAIHSKEYYELMSETYSALTFGIYVTGGGLNVETYADNDANGIDDAGDGAWHKNNTWITYSVTVDYLLDSWNSLNDLTSECKGWADADNKKGNGNATHSMLFCTLYGTTTGTNIVSIGKFGSVAKEIEQLEIAGVNLVETAENPTYNLLALDTESKLANIPYAAKLVSTSGKVIWVKDATNIITANVPQGVYTAYAVCNGKEYMSATLDIYTKADGLVWNIIDEDISNYAKAYYYGSTSTTPYASAILANGDETALTDKTGSYLKVDMKTYTDGEDGREVVGIQILPLHSKEYYQAFLDTGNTYNLKFDYYMDLTHVYQNRPTLIPGAELQYYQFSSNTLLYKKYNRWSTMTIALADIMTNWDTVTTIGKATYYNRNLLSARLYYGMTSGQTIGTMYIGNMYVAETQPA